MYDNDDARPPLAAITETLAATAVPTVVQMLLRPKPEEGDRSGSLAS